MTAVASVVVAVGINPPLESSDVDAKERSIAESDTPDSNVGPGRWQRFRTDSLTGIKQRENFTEEQMEAIRQLEALGYN